MRKENVYLFLTLSMCIFCTSCLSPKGNKGFDTLKAGVGLNNNIDVPIQSSVGRDISLGFVGGNIGLTIIGLALCGVAYKAVK